MFPDVDGCVTCGDNMEHAYEMASDALGLVLSYMEDNKEPIPFPSPPRNVLLENNQFLVVIEFDMAAYKRKNGSRAVKKHLAFGNGLTKKLQRKVSIFSNSSRNTD